MRVPILVPAAAALLLCASAAAACDECLRRGVNLHAPPTGAGGALNFSNASLVSPAYSSRPGASVKLFLDLDGIDYQGTWAGRTPGAVPAYDTDGNPLTFSQQELANIREIWIRVAEAYSPFDVDVTTIDPGDFTQPRLNTRIIIGGSNTWYSSGAGGVAYVGGFPFNNATPSEEWRTGWAFPANLGGGFPKYVSDATIHEFGHQVGLAHQAEFDEDGNFVQAYRRSLDGGLTAPHMGVAYGAIRGLWSDGPRAAGNPPQPQQQFDLDIIASLSEAPVTYPWNGYWNGFGFRPDDWANDIASAAILTPSAGVLTSFGVIEQSSDADMFYFFSEGGDVDIQVHGAEFGQMLDIVLNLYNSAGELIFADNPPLTLDPDLTYGLDASFAGFLQEGDYYVGVLSNGEYGDIGQFFLTVSGSVSVPEPAGAAGLLALAGLFLRRRGR